MEATILRSTLRPLLLMLTVAIFTGGCASNRLAPVRAVMVATRTATTIEVDGRLREPVWHDAAVYPLQSPQAPVRESGRVRLAWDDTALYVAIELDDSDIVAEGDRDQMHHYLLGDLVELFLRPAESTWYWELYTTPRGHKSEFFFPGRGRLGLPSNYSDDARRHLRVAASVAGTVNDWHDRDRGWTVEMAVSATDLTEYGNAFGPGSRWHMLLARYNYSRYLDNKELSAAPILPELNFHRLESYAELKFE